MTLSDPFCVGRYRDEFLDLMRSGTVDIVFANEAEALSLYQTDDFDAALSRHRRRLQARRRHPIARRARVVLGGGETRRRSGRSRSTKLVDTTGAGDLYRRRLPARLYRGPLAARTAASSASSRPAIIIQQIGPRPQISLRQAAQATPA